MADVILFHHALGRTSGVHGLADQLTGAGHSVHVPDLFDGATFSTIEEGVAHAEDVGFDAIVERGVAAAADLPPRLVYIGISLGVLPAQRLAQTRAGAAAAVLISSCVPAAHFGGWPDAVPVQVHAMEDDPIFVDDGDIDAARSLVDTVTDARLFLYPGDQHLFVDNSIGSYDATATGLLVRRVLDLLATVD